MAKRVLVLQNYWDDPPGQLGELMQKHGIDFDVIKVNEVSNPAEALSDLAAYAAIITLGGPQHSGAEDMHSYFAEEKRVIRTAVERDIPYLGICLGGQLLALVLDAPVTRHSMTEIGFYEVQLTEEGKIDPLYEGLPGRQCVYHWHSDTFGIPVGAVKLATSDNTSNQAFRFGRRAYALQFHIELTPAILDIWLGSPECVQDIIDVLGPGAIEKLQEQRHAYYPIYREQTRKMFENFLKISDLL